MSRLVEPNIAEHWYLLGRAYVRQGKYDDVIDAVMQAVRLARTVSGFFITYRPISCHLRRYHDAHDLDALFRAAERNPSDSYLVWDDQGVLLCPE